MEKIPYGYMEKDGNLVPHPIDSQMVQFAFAKTVAYSEHPPAVLVHETIKRIYEDEGERLSYEEAEKRVLPSSIEAYLLNEMNTKKSMFEENGNNDPEELNRILELDMEQIEGTMSDEVTEEEAGCDIDEGPVMTM